MNTSQFLTEYHPRLTHPRAFTALSQAIYSFILGKQTDPNVHLFVFYVNKTETEKNI